jgi:hypothetical protein
VMRRCARQLSATANNTEHARDKAAFATPNSRAPDLKVTSRAGTGVAEVTDQC